MTRHSLSSDDEAHRRRWPCGGGERSDPDAVPVSTVLTLVAAAMSAGLDVVSAVQTVGAAVGGERGDELQAAARGISDGVPWSVTWESAGSRWSPLEQALRPCWEAGASPGPALAASSRAIASKARRDGEKAMAELSVTLSLPLTLCLLPAFALVGIIPMIIAVAMGSGISIGS